jgi:C4-dicarboxylate transporter DctM subunit
MAGAAPSAKPAPFLKPLDVVDRGVLLAESSLSLVVVTLMVLFAVTEAFSRILSMLGGARVQPLLDFAQPVLHASSDVMMNGTIWAAFLGASFATRGRRHLAIDVLGRLLPDRARRMMVGVSASLGSIVAFALASGILDALHHQATAANEQLAQQAGLGIEAAVNRGYEFQYIIPGGFLLIGIRLVLHAFHEFLAARRGVGPEGPAIVAEEDALRFAPVSQANATEIGIAIAALLGLLAIAAKSTIVGSLGVAVGIAVLMLALALMLRWSKSKSLAPTVAQEDLPTPPTSIADLAISAAAVSAVLGVAMFGVSHIPSIPIGVGIGFFVLMALMGAPLFTFLGGLALFLWLHGTQDVPAMSLANSVEDVLGPHFATMSVLPTIPIFTLAGYLMSESKTPQRLVRVARAFLGFAPGGLAIVCVLASAFFTVFSGASGITIVAIGGLLLPALLKDNYPEKFSLGLVTTGGALGITFPPCLPLIVYGIVAGLQEVPPGHERLELQKFLLAGLPSGLLLIGLLCIYCVIMGVRQNVPRSKFDGKEAFAALWEAKWELLLPVFLLGGLATGVFNPAQAAAFTAFYVFVIEVFIYKDLSLTKDIPRIVPESMVLVGAIFVKLCAATVLTFFFVQAQTADKLFEALTCGAPAQAYLAAHSDTLGTCREAVNSLAEMGQSAGGMIDSQISFLIALNLFLLVVGMLMDIFSAIVVIVPLISGIAMHFNINPYHLGVVFLLNLEIGYLMPPMGLNLFIAGFRFNKPVPDLYKVVLPFIGIFAVALLVTTYFPGLTLAMPGLSQETHAASPVANEPAPSNEPAPAQGEPTPAVPAPAAGDCDTPRDGESFEDFDARCMQAPAAEAPPAEAPAADAPAAPAAAPSDCETPRDGESFEAFSTRCNL